MLRFKKWIQSPYKFLLLALIIIIVSSFLANFFNTSAYTVDVKRISFDTDKGELSGLLYMPKTANETNPRPTIITTHGYLNSAEMQDAGAIEMSKRGFVVLALDMYEHGHSTVNGPVNVNEAFFSFWPNSLNDAVNYMYEQNYVMKDADGNGIIAVAGHSMGGFSTTMAMVMDEQQYAETGYRKIKAGLTMGADFLWTSYLNIDEKTANAAMGPRISGKVAGHFDEFFFDMEAAGASRSVQYKDYLKSDEGIDFLGNPLQPEEGEFYTLENGGERVIYTPNETHPWNHFSRETTKDQINFYLEAFKGDITDAQVPLNAENQTWYLKELFELFALVGFFLMFVPLIQIIQGKISVLAMHSKAVAVDNQPFKNNFDKIALLLIIVVSTALPALLYPTLMDKVPENLMKLRTVIDVIFVLGLIVFIGSFLTKVFKNKIDKVMSLVVLITAAMGHLVLTYSDKVLTLSRYFNAPTVNAFAYWALVSAIISILLIGVIHFMSRDRQEIKLEAYGLSRQALDILRGLVSAIIAVIVGCLILFIIDAVFKTDFRFWTFAVKTFNMKQLLAAVRVMPFFFIFYLVNGISLNKLFSHRKHQKSLAVLTNIGGLLVFLILQYGFLFISGVGLLPSQSLNSIILIGMVPVLLIAGIYSRSMTQRTGNVYTAAFLNTILMTLLTVANTVVYSNLM